MSGRLTAAVRPVRLGMADAGRGFDAALAGKPVVLVADSGERLPCAPDRWFGPAAGEDEWLLARCSGPTADLGCGPGRLVTALVARGVPALGVDHCELAVWQCRARGAPAVRSDVFARLPHEGGWDHVLLADGNIGIGGDPRALLNRCARLVRPGGTLLIETGSSGPPGHGGSWFGRARFHDRHGRHPVSDWFAWAVVTLPTLAALARGLGMIVGEVYQGGRGFVRLRVPTL